MIDHDISREKKDDPTVYKSLGDRFFSEERYEVALHQYLQAVEADPDYIEAWNKLHDALVQLGRTNDAQEVAFKLCELKDRTSSNCIDETYTTESPLFKKDITPEMVGSLLQNPQKLKRNRSSFILPMLLCACILVFYLFGTNSQFFVSTPFPQGETILDTSLFVSGWWTTPIMGGHTYDIQLDSNQPVTLYICEKINALQSGGIECQGNVQQQLIEFATSYYSTVTFPIDVGDLLLIAQENDTNFHLRITRIS
jgi:tetratricopeptide (TPR) repeat protein